MLTHTKALPGPCDPRFRNHARGGIIVLEAVVAMMRK